jgi:hypothetical protein
LLPDLDERLYILRAGNSPIHYAAILVGSLVRVLHVLLAEMSEVMAKLLELLLGQNLFLAGIGTPGHRGKILFRRMFA